MEKHSALFKKVILEVVDNQLKSDEVPEVKETLERLVSEGFTEKRAKKMIAAVVLAEIFYVQKNLREFDREKYVKALKRLPELPDDDYE